MRKIACTMRSQDRAKRVMIYETETGTYLFLYLSLEDGHGYADEWYESTAQAEAVCVNLYGITAADWQLIDDPLEHCQHDWIAPVRVKGRESGKPEWGVFERYEDGTWKLIKDGRSRVR